VIADIDSPTMSRHRNRDGSIPEPLRPLRPDRPMQETVDRWSAVHRSVSIPIRVRASESPMPHFTSWPQRTLSNGYRSGAWIASWMWSRRILGSTSVCDRYRYEHQQGST
jgi:hypothetical protein